jgi:hypothetical protein
LDEFVALRGLSIEVHSGQCVGLLRSPCGGMKRRLTFVRALLADPEPQRIRQGGQRAGQAPYNRKLRNPKPPFP